MIGSSLSAASCTIGIKCRLYFIIRNHNGSRMNCMYTCMYLCYGPLKRIAYVAASMCPHLRGSKRSSLLADQVKEQDQHHKGKTRGQGAEEKEREPHLRRECNTFRFEASSDNNSFASSFLHALFCSTLHTGIMSESTS